MSFTTKDLELAEKSKFDDCEWVMDWKKFKALVARLRASEALHKYTHHSAICSLGKPTCVCGLDEARLDYRQSIGQDKGEAR